jgi:hypothetical protein
MMALLLLLLLLLLLPAILLLPAVGAATGSAEIFVSPSGSDSSGDGTRAQPFASLAKAQAAARATPPHPGAGVTVRIGAGEYFQPSPLVLTAADSGVSWVGEGAGATVVRGGHPVTGWERHVPPHLPNGSASNVWRALNPAPGTPFFQLVEGRAPATVARHPNKGAGWLYNWSSTTVAGRPGVRWDDATGLPAQFEMQYASAYVWHPYGYSELTGLANASFATREVALYPTPHTMLVKAHFEGALEFLDAPGEWALGEDGYVYLWPTQAGASPNSMNISAAFAPRVIDVRGASTENADVVRDITVANLSLVGSGWLRNFECEWADRMNSQPARDPTGEWAFTREGMVRIENATNITVVGCELLAAGTSAVWMEHFAQSCTISSNWIEHASFTGVHVNGYGADRKTRLLRRLYICKRSFYQDRLGTDIGTTPKSAILCRH